MKVRLSLEEKNFLIKLNSCFLKNINLQFLDYSNCVILHNIAEEDILKLREACLDYLVKYGFEYDYTANQEGKISEALIDKLFIE